MGALCRTSTSAREHTQTAHGAPVDDVGDFDGEVEVPLLGFVWLGLRNARHRAVTRTLHNNRHRQGRVYAPLDQQKPSRSHAANKSSRLHARDISNTLLMPESEPQIYTAGSLTHILPTTSSFWNRALHNLCMSRSQPFLPSRFSAFGWRVHVCGQPRITFRMHQQGGVSVVR
jgi:hypothetical protein